VSVGARVEDLLRGLAPQVLGVLARRYGRFDAAEDAVQEALLAAAVQWPGDGVPENPRGWLITVASRRLTDELRSEQSRRRREDTAAALVPFGESVVPAPGDEPPAEEDDTLTLLFLCCHPALSPASQVALTLRAVGGLTTAQIASAFLVPEATMAQRISRAKQRIKATGASFDPPPERERTERLDAVLHVLYLIFNEGYTATSGPDLQRTELTREAIRLTRAVHDLLPDDGEVPGLLALMLLTDARRPARTRSDGALVPLAEQDRALWNRGYITEGVSLVTTALSRSAPGPYQLQAAIAAVHAEAARAEDTDWPQIVALYRLLERLSPNPMVTLNHAVAVAMVHGPRAGLELLGTLDGDDRVATHHRLDAVRAHLLELAGDQAAARAGYLSAARRTTSLPEQRYLEGRAARVTSPKASGEERACSPGRRNHIPSPSSG
jgi:RNA polymerase sigma factor (sigma-70 family)